MAGVRFVAVTELSVKATAIVSDAEKTGIQVIITKRGKPVALLKKAHRTSKGMLETVSFFKNNTIQLIKATEAGKSFIITRFNEPVVSLTKALNDSFRIGK
jgi:antitoxin (DNA-binding transcriptional repressor) of toxin-antitoxin stability system